MNNSLVDTTINYDKSNRVEMNDFLNKLYSIAKSNPTIYITSDMVYSLLKHYSMKYNEVDNYGQGIDTKFLFDRWANRFRNKKTRAFCDEVNFSYWFQFINDPNDSREGDNYIKLYIPIDYDHLENGVNELFDFMERENIVHYSKVGSKMRVDNVIVRLRKGDVVSAKKIINFLSNNSYLKNGLNMCNPFIPTINGIGYMDEHGNSYNSDISHLMSSYINKCVNRNKIPNIDDFRVFVFNNSSDKLLINTFENAYCGPKQNKNERIKTNYEPSMEQKTTILFDALKATYIKYGVNQIKNALYNIITNGYYDNITNGTKYMNLRGRLKNNVSPEEVYKIVSSSLSSLTNGGLNLNKGLDEGINIFCTLVFTNDLSLIIDEISNVTLENYDTNQLIYALNQFYYNNDSGAFSSFSKGSKEINYRQKLRKLFNRDNLLNSIRISLSNKGYNIGYLDEKNLFKVYAESLKKGYYTKMDNRPKLSAF